MWAKIFTIKITKDLKYFSLCALNLFKTRVSHFELNYWNKFPRHSNFLRCTCMSSMSPWDLSSWYIYAKTYNIDILKVLIDWNIVKANILAFFLIVASAGSSFSFFFLTVCQTQDSYFDNAENRAMPENQSSHSLSSLVYYLCLTVLRDYLTLFNISKKVMISVKLFTVKVNSIHKYYSVYFSIRPISRLIHQTHIECLAQICFRFELCSLSVISAVCGSLKNNLLKWPGWFPLCILLCSFSSFKEHLLVKSIYRDKNSCHLMLMFEFNYI